MPKIFVICRPYARIGAFPRSRLQTVLLVEKATTKYHKRLPQPEVLRNDPQSVDTGADFVTQSLAVQFHVLKSVCLSDRRQACSLVKFWRKEALLTIVVTNQTLNTRVMNVIGFASHSLHHAYMPNRPNRSRVARAAGREVSACSETQRPIV